jgi:hypothetical protein
VLSAVLVWVDGETFCEVIGSSTIEWPHDDLGGRERGRTCSWQGGLTSSARRRTAGRTSVAQPRPDVDSCRSG